LLNVAGPKNSDTDFNAYINRSAPFAFWDIQSNPNPTIVNYVGREANIDPSLYIETAKDPYELIKEEYDKMEQDFLNEGNV
jgi:hypothetical protein